MENRTDKTKRILMRQGVRKLKTLGFSHVTLQSTLSNEIYRLYFLKFLKERELSGNTDEAASAVQIRKIVEEM